MANVACILKERDRRGLLLANRANSGLPPYSYGDLCNQLWFTPKGSHVGFSGVEFRMIAGETNSRPYRRCAVHKRAAMRLPGHGYTGNRQITPAAHARALKRVWATQVAFQSAFLNFQCRTLPARLLIVSRPGNVLENVVFFVDPDPDDARLAAVSGSAFFRGGKLNAALVGRNPAAVFEGAKLTSPVCLDVIRVRHAVGEISLRHVLPP